MVNNLILESTQLERSQRIAARLLSFMPPLHKLPPKIFRPLFLIMDRIMGIKKEDMHSVVDYLIPTTTNENGRVHKLKIRAYYPKPDDSTQDSSKQKSMVYFHGGGCVIGSIETHDRFCRYLAKHSNTIIISVDYRLAPEHKFPVPIYDAIDAWNWINHHHKQLNLNPEHIGVGGDSAGGYLACLIGLTSLQEALPVKSNKAPSFQFLLYPMLDLQGLTQSYKKFTKHLILTKALMDYFRGHYLNSSNDYSQPLASPLQADDISMSAKTYLLTLGHDPLRDDGIAYGERLKKQGIQTDHEHYDDCMHAFISVTKLSQRAREATQSVAAALARM